MKKFGGIDAGGTTFKCVVAGQDGTIFEQARFPSLDSAQTLKACISFFTRHLDSISGLGIASFGPIDIDPTSSRYGQILETPKKGWSGVNLKSGFDNALGVNCVVNTDVNGALLGEMQWGRAQGVNSAAYVTIGTGIGAGIFLNGGFVGAPTHPEFGHIRLERHQHDDFEGICSIHRNCLEGLASAPALSARFGPTKDMDINHKGWEIESWYLAQACLSLYLTIRPDRIILGGGIMLANGLLDKVRNETEKLLNGYTDMKSSEIEQLIVTPGLGDNAGVLGAVCLAIQAQR
ncbi:ROK family protein [Fretibacter rubidus]|uniref:ROK family protein n=1 Tax=Fretibacter rubidus TaxID=570162 RepID=UPI00352B4C61